MLLQIILSIFIVLIFTFLVGFTINVLLFSKLLKNQSSTIFFHSSIFTGFMSLTIGTALLTTLGHTIFIISLLPIGFLVYRNFSVPDFSGSNLRKYFIDALLPFSFLFLCVLFSLLLLVLKYDYFSRDTLNLLWVDYGFYINVAEYFGITSLEQSTSWYILYSNYSSEHLIFMPYHYGDIWIYRWISFFNFLEIMPILYYGYVFLGLLATFAYSSMVALTSTFFNRKNTVYIHIFALLLLFCVPFDYYLKNVGGNLLTLPKLFFFLVLLSYALLFIYKNKYIEGLCLLCIVPVAHIFYAPSIYTALFLMSIIIFILNKKNNSLLKLDVIYSFLIPIACALLIIIYYKDFISSLSTSKELTQQVIEDSPSLIRIIWDMAKDHIWFWFAYLSVFIVLLTKKSEWEDKKTALLLFFIVFFQIFSFYFTFKLNIPESNQIYILLSSATPILLCFLIYSIKKYYSFLFKTIPFDWIFILSFFFVSIFIYLKDKHGKEVDRNFVQEIRTTTLKVKNKQGIYYGSKDNFQDQSPHFVGGVANLLKTLGDEFWAININYAYSIYEFDNQMKSELNKKVPLELIKNTPYYKFYEAKKDIIDNETDLQIAFIEEMKIEFVIAVALEEIPLKIRQKAKTILIDPQSKIAFLLLK